MSYCIARTVQGGFDTVVAHAQEALARHGFGVLSDIDVAATLKKKLGVDVAPYRILGACNPQFAHQALEMEPMLGVLLPCNVIVRAAGAGAVQVAAVDPVVQLGKTGNAKLAPVAAEVRRLLTAVVDAVAASCSAA
jgi:uncharacterized protein (DUF302 family)